ncbi:hypothetical protein [Paraburkholderia sp. GAS41]
MAAHTLAMLLTVHITPADGQERAGGRACASGSARHRSDGETCVC